MENMQEVLKRLQTILPKEKIKINEPMSKHTSFKVGGEAEIFITATEIDEIIEINSICQEQNIELQIIGNGSNLLVLDEGFKGIILKIELDNIVIKQTENDYIICAGAGVKLMELAQKLKVNGITGFEELSGIPGTIGGANIMNAGAYGKEFSDILIETTVFNRKTGQIEIIEKESQKLAYRTSMFKNNKYIIIGVELKLYKGEIKDIEEKMEQYLNQRKDKQPLEYPSAGSIFKRKNGFIVSKLIDECGLKGYKIGGAQISEKHAGFIINTGTATAKEILQLIEYTKKKVYEKFGVQIEEEIEIIGNINGRESE